MKSIIIALELTVTKSKRKETAQADNDECCAGGAVAGVSLVEEEVLGFASQQKLPVVWIADRKACTGDTVLTIRPL